MNRRIGQQRCARSGWPQNASDKSMPVTLELLACSKVAHSISFYSKTWRVFPRALAQWSWNVSSMLVWLPSSQLTSTSKRNCKNMTDSGIDFTPMLFAMVGKVALNKRLVCRGPHSFSTGGGTRYAGAAVQSTSTESGAKKLEPRSWMKPDSGPVRASFDQKIV